MAGFDKVEVWAVRCWLIGGDTKQHIANVLDTMHGGLMQPYLHGLQTHALGENLKITAPLYILLMECR